MGTLGWVFLGIAFLIFIMVANNSWSFVWNKIRGVAPPATSSQPQIMTVPNPIPGGQPLQVYG